MMKKLKESYQQVKQRLWDRYTKSTFIRHKRQTQKLLKEHAVTEGLIYQKWQVINETKSIVHILTVDTTKREIDLVTHDGPETITTTAQKQKEALAFVNAGFFNVTNHHTIHTLIKDRKLERLGYFNQDDETGYFHKPTGVAVNQQQLLICRYQLKVIVEGTTVNAFLFSPTDARDRIIYQVPVKSYKVKPNSGDFYVIIKPKNEANWQLNNVYQVDVLASGTITSSSVPTLSEMSYALVVPGQEKDTIVQLKNEIKRGTLSIRVKMFNEMTQSDSDSFESFLGSGPLLIEDYQPVLSLTKSSPKGQLIAPRTVVATKDNGRTVSFVVVDGRLPFYSDGMTLQQLTDMLMTFGYEQALNLDGGSSSSMVINRKEINKRTSQPLRKLPHVFRIK